MIMSKSSITKLWNDIQICSESSTGYFIVLPFQESLSNLDEIFFTDTLEINLSFKLS